MNEPDKAEKQRVEDELAAIEQTENTTTDEQDSEVVETTVETKPIKIEPEVIGKREEVISPAPLSPAVSPVVAPNTSGALVLQWLSYAFWFWFSVSMSWLAAVVINYYIAGNPDYNWSDMLAYPLASVIIMLIIALVTDMFYAKHEPVKKAGGANVIMLLHVVPFILIGIGALVTIVFSLIRMLLNSDPAATYDGPIKVMIVAAIVVVLFGLAAVRALYGGSKTKLRLAAWGVFTLFAVGFIIAGIAGPAAESLRTKEDRLIEQALPSLSSDIREYTVTNSKLPASLTDVTYDGSSIGDSVQKLIDSKLVTYKANTIPSSTGNSYSPEYPLDKDVSVQGSVGSSVLYPDSNTAKRFYYQLCTTYKYEKKDRYNYTQDSSNDAYTVGPGVGASSNYRYSYVTSISQHPAGEVCYNLYADGAYSYGSPKVLN